MKKILTAILALIACANVSAQQVDYNVIPMPKAVNVDSTQSFTLRTGMGLAYDAGNP